MTLTLGFSYTMDNRGIEVSDVHVAEDNRKGQSKDDSQMEGVNNEKEIQELKKKLKLHFRDDFTKTCNKDRPRCTCLPFKFVLAFFKIVFVTIQLIRFGDDRTEFSNFLDKNNIALKNMLLKDWKSEFETMPYPPSTGKYAVYAIKDLNEHIEWAINKVYSLPTVSVGSFFIRNENDAVQVCVDYYRNGVYNQTNKRLHIDLAYQEDCKYVGKKFASDFGLNVTIEDLMRSVNGVLVRLLSVRVKFAVESIYVRRIGVQCFNIDGEILFDNREINGQMLVTLATNIAEFDCQGTTVAKAEPGDIFMYVSVMLLSILSFIFSGKSFVSSATLAHDTLLSTTRHTLYDVCGILLSTGCLLVWLGILHYLNFIPSFYLLFAIIENSALSVLQFLICIVVIYIGFALCGWIVLGPFHLKFATLGSTIQSLLALLNGDEIFVTFTAIEEYKTTAVVFNNIFIALFIFVFTIIALNVFIAIFNTTYEEIQKYQHLDKKIKEKDGESEDPFDGLSEVQKWLRRYRLPRFGKDKESTETDSTPEQ